jgi:pimeloyl-ACP methyl ester carboxylesterase
MKPITPALHHLFGDREFHDSCAFHPAKNTRKHETLILIHGLLRTYRSMRRLGKHLSQQGYDVYLYGYPSSRYGIEDHSLRFQNFLRYLREHRKLEGEFHVITHSLGGIIARHAFCNLNHNSKLHCQKLIMLAPPNQGSQAATRIVQRLPLITRWLKPLSQITDKPNAYVHQIGIPDTSIGIIAATFDGKVPLHATHLPTEADFTRIATNHTFVINHRHTRQAILNFLAHGRFTALVKSRNIETLDDSQNKETN